MKSKSIVTGILIIFVVISVALLTAKEIRKEPVSVQGRSADLSTSAPAPTSRQATTTTSNPARSHKVVVYYFHGNVRCTACRKIETYTTEGIKKGFPDAIRKGDLELRVVNIEVPENRHFIKDYHLYTKSVVVTDSIRGKQVRWKNLDKVWEMIYDKNAFLEYLRDEVKSYLGK